MCRPQAQLHALQSSSPSIILAVRIHFAGCSASASPPSKRFMINAIPALLESSASPSSPVQPRHFASAAIGARALPALTPPTAAMTYSDPFPEKRPSFSRFPEVISHCIAPLNREMPFGRAALPIPTIPGTPVDGEARVPPGQQRAGELRVEQPSLQKEGNHLAPPGFAWLNSRANGYKMKRSWRLNPPSKISV